MSLRRERGREREEGVRERDNRKKKGDENLTFQTICLEKAFTVGAIVE